MSLPLEQQVCSLGLAKRLRELGVKQESLWVWVAGFPSRIERNVTDKPWVDGRVFSAFTVAELERILPLGVNIAYKNGAPRDSNHYRSMMRSSGDRYCVAYRHGSYSSDSWIDRRADTFADALAEMLVYLIENKLITV
jgi:hypothetical protein